MSCGEQQASPSAAGDRNLLRRLPWLSTHGPCMALGLSRGFFTCRVSGGDPSTPAWGWGPGTHSGARPGTAEVPGVWMQHAPWHCGVWGEGWGGACRPPACLPNTALGSTSRRCLLLHPKASQFPPVPCHRASAVSQQPPRAVAPESLHSGSRAA